MLLPVFFLFEFELQGHVESQPGCLTLIQQEQMPAVYSIVSKGTNTSEANVAQLFWMLRA